MIQVSKIKQQVKSGIISKIAMNGRHINLRSIFTTQKYSLLGTGLRNNITGAILFATSFKELDLIEADRCDAPMNLNVLFYFVLKTCNHIYTCALFYSFILFSLYFYGSIQSTFF